MELVRPECIKPGPTRCSCQTAPLRPSHDRPPRTRPTSARHACPLRPLLLQQLQRLLRQPRPLWRRHRWRRRRSVIPAAHPEHDADATRAQARRSCSCSSSAAAPSARAAHASSAPARACRAASSGPCTSPLPPSAPAAWVLADRAWPDTVRLDMRRPDTAWPRLAVARR
jgi:hypothetical protein